jgi:LysM repeat protein
VSDDEFDDLGSFGLPPDEPSPPREPVTPPDPTELQPGEPGLDPTVLAGDPDDIATRSLEALEDLTRAPRRRRRAEPEPAPPEKTRRAAASAARTRKGKAAGPAASPATTPVSPGTAPTPFASIERRSARSAARRGQTTIPRLVAPVVFLIAVLVLIGVLINSGGSKSTPAAKPAGGKKTATAKPTTSASTTGKPVVATTYVVKAGDTISGIASKHHTTQTAILALNPKLDPNTLSVGEKIKLPPPGQ